jgi:hypothetical protein
MGAGASGHYATLLDRIHTYLLPRSYVEIGVNSGKSLALALPGTRCVGIDPDPKISFPVDEGAQIIASTSDDFFAAHDVSGVLDRQPVDLAFIDGMHLFEFALRDFMNIEPHCHRDSVVMFHDCYPIDQVTSARERTTERWSGDVWKVIVCLKQLRPDLQIATVDVPPTGLGIVTRLDPGSTILRERYDEIVSRFVGLDYDDLHGAKADTLNRVPDDWNAVRSLLPAPYREADRAKLVRRRALRPRPGEPRTAASYVRRWAALTPVGPALRKAKQSLTGRRQPQ